MNLEDVKRFTCDLIESKKDNLKNLSYEIWNNPETAFEEFKCHEIITLFLEKSGFHVQKKHPLTTSFIAESIIGKSGPVVGICCEYDALPGIGHGCGHNLIAECAVGAGLAVKEAIRKYGLPGKVIIFGTPAEEAGGGKVEMLKAQVFEGCDVCIMAHPALYDLPDPIMVAVSQFKIAFKGKPAHAAAAPWEGQNALDAAVQCYCNISMLRQQIKPTSRVHAIISKGGTVPNIIPELAELFIFVRSVTDKEMWDLKERVVSCGNGAATSTGCTLEITEVAEYNALKTNETLMNLFIKNSENLGVDFNYTGSKQGGSTDMGNVSVALPSIHPKFKVDSKTNIHTAGFTDAAILDENQIPTLRVAKSLAMTAIDVLASDSHILEQIKKDFIDEDK
eukprot:TCONS_00007619-protein